MNRGAISILVALIAAAILVGIGGFVYYPQKEHWMDFDTLRFRTNQRVFVYRYDSRIVDTWATARFQPIREDNWTFLLSHGLNVRVNTHAGQLMSGIQQLDFVLESEGVSQHVRDHALKRLLQILHTRSDPLQRVSDASDWIQCVVENGYLDANSDSDPDSVLLDLMDQCPNP